MNVPGLGIIPIARLYLYFREARNPDGTTSNRGLRVEAVQHMANGAFGDSWCMEALWDWLDFFFANAEDAGIPRQQSVQSFREFCQGKGWQIDLARVQPGDVVVSVDANNHGHHIALVTVMTPLTAIAGNTSADGISSNGDRCAEHPISPANKEFYRIPGVVA